MGIAMDGIALVLAIVALAVWLGVCCWVVVRLSRMDAALVSKVLWVVAILAFPIAGLIAFLLLADRTPQLERELGIRRS